jgi:dTDP-glucose 4,6-dehydratase
MQAPKRKFLVTGGAGFIGSNFVKRLISKGESVRVLDKLTYAGNLKSIQGFIDQGQLDFFHGDICDPVVVREAMDSVDVVVNFAAESHVDRSIESSTEFVRTNVLGTENLLAHALMLKTKVFIQISTDEVYGSIHHGSWKEDSPLKPNSPYSASKAAADLLAISYYKTHGLDIRITRCCNNYGPNQLPEKIIPSFITKLIKQEKIPLYGDGKNIREWIHVDDHCSAIELVIDAGKPGEVYNIGSGFELENVELANMLLRIFNLDTSFIQMVEDRKGHDLRYSVDSRKMQNLGHNPRKDFRKGLLETIDWYQENLDHWKPTA